MRTFYALPLGLLSLIALLFLTSYSEATAQRGRRDRNKDRPEWVESKPSDAINYYGVGTASMSANSDYQRIAKEGALADLSSDIVVSLASTTESKIVEENGEFNEYYEEAVSAITENNLEGYEQVETYNEDGVYWVLYRLNKDLYLRNKRQRFSQAMGNSKQLYTQASQLEQGGDIYQAFLLYTQALEPLLPYLVSAIEPEFKGDATEQNTKLTTKLINILSGIRFENTGGNPSYKLGSGQQLELPIKVTYRNESGREVPLSKFPVLFSFTRGEGEFVSGVANSDPNGMATGVITRINGGKGATVVMATMDTEPFKVLEDRRVSLYSIGNIAPPRAAIRITTTGPAVFIESVERSLGKDLEVPLLYTVVSDFLAANGCVVNPDDGNYDYEITINAQTRKGTSASGAYSALLDLNIVAIDALTGEELASSALRNLKGTKFDFENASQAAFDKARDEILANFLPEFLDKIY